MNSTPSTDVDYLRRVEDLDFDELTQLREACEHKMQELRMRAKAEMIGKANQMGLDLADLATGTKKKRRPRGHGNGEAPTESPTTTITADEA